ncbi:sulfite reductase, dissimilatory-type subunit alpha [bacterium BMS3Abin07]|nr:sulfite reductase, dissimilatory-type subunit alpha [bacterium BMS3Abin07]HDL20334.1 dissimilatory-type sulfite reductase subunit alpha [Nitrospirota bacterium]HDO22677.1 dissimilatory-type sulfite reductase subunit alpha [Nitrospirota bacterium]HDZ89039.1 dissimilatory-type sulfite reductase subunit alpha [Nitrospirota bacterium]
MAKKYDTPMLDELKKGAFPSFVTEIEKAAEKTHYAEDLLGQLELSYKEKRTHWKHGGIVGVRGYGGGVIGRYSDIPDQFPGVAHFHTIRVNQPAGWFYKADALLEICDIWDKYGSGITNMHGSTGDLILLGTNSDSLEPIFAELSSRGWDLGGSGSAVRTPSCCVGPGRCEWSCIDSLDITDNVTREYQDELHRPMFPYKYKFKVSGCSIDCIASMARSDCSIIGTWRDDIKIDQAEVKNYADSAMDIQSEVIDMCPTGCMSFDGGKLSIDNENCNRCMHCISKMTKALRPGDDKGATILIGSHAPFVRGAQLCQVIVPFMKMEPPYKELKDLTQKIWDWWDEHGKNRERVGELIERMGMRNFLEAVELEPDPIMVKEPRRDPFYFWTEEDLKN